jgi:hypothetical protein
MANHAEGPVKYAMVVEEAQDDTLFMYPRPSQWSKFKNNTWAVELVTWLPSAGIFFSVYAIFRHYDNQPVLQWQYSLTINMVLSFLGNILKACLFTTVQSAIEIAALLLWLWTIVKGRHQPLWKSSTLPMLRCQLVEADGRQTMMPKDVAGMEKVAEGARVELRNDRRSAALVKDGF